MSIKYNIGESTGPKARASNPMMPSRSEKGSQGVTPPPVDKEHAPSDETCLHRRQSAAGCSAARRYHQSTRHCRRCQSILRRKGAAVDPSPPTGKPEARRRWRQEGYEQLRGALVQDNKCVEKRTAEPEKRSIKPGQKPLQCQGRSLGTDSVTGKRRGGVKPPSIGEISSSRR